MQHLMRILNDPKATKADLRNALAKSLGVDAPVFDREQVSTSLFKGCMQHFCAAYQQYTGMPYHFEARDGAALSSILNHLREMLPGKDETELLVNFRALVDHLPEWYRQNQFNLPVINRKFNDIVLSIKKQRNGNNSSSISQEYKYRVARDLFA